VPNDRPLAAGAVHQYHQLQHARTKTSAPGHAQSPQTHEDELNFITCTA
jgi:hypothetical protein